MNAQANLRSFVSLKDKRLLFIAPHPDDDAIGCGALLLHLAAQNAQIHIAYAVSGFNGVTDRFAQIVAQANDPKTKRMIRQTEAIACCNHLGAHPHFWNLPFYEEQRCETTDVDNAVITQSIQEINPDIIFLIDEASDPHGTHGLVRTAVLNALKAIDFGGVVVGYRVWGLSYPDCHCDITLFFDDDFMKSKSELISIYKSQVKDPAFPHERHSFVDLVKIANSKIAQECEAELPYAECYKVFS